MTPQEPEIGKFLIFLLTKGRFAKTLSVQSAKPLQVKPLLRQEKLLLFQPKVDVFAKTNYSLMENVTMTIKSSFCAVKMPVLKTNSQPGVYGLIEIIQVEMEIMKQWKISWMKITLMCVKNL